VLKYKDTKAGMPDFSWYNKTKMAKKITKWPQNLPNRHKVHQSAIKYTILP
jgi:hypothetical protein